MTTIILTEEELNKKLEEAELSGYQHALREVAGLRKDFIKCPIDCFDRCDISSPSEMHKAPCKGNMFCMYAKQGYDAIDAILEQTRYWE